MGTAYEVVTGRVTNPSTTLTALTANTGDSFTVRNFPEGSPAYLEGMWAKGATAGELRVRSPRLHDNVQNLRFPYQVNTPRNLLDDMSEQMLYPQDTLSVEQSGGAAETDVGAIANYYSNLPGTDARLAMWEQIRPRIQNLLTIEVSITGAGTLGDWSAGTPIDTTFDLLKANVDYAILGYVVTNAVLAIAIAGSDTGNLKVGGPGSSEILETRNYFVRQAIQHATPHIPVINAANKSGTLAYQVDNAAGATNSVAFFAAQLSTGAV